MKVMLYLLVLPLLASCSPLTIQTIATDIRAPTSTIQPSPEPTSTISTATVTFTSTIPPTLTPILCDPRIADFCITDGHFLLQRPIQPPYNDSVERTYPFGSTADGARDPHHGVEFENEFSTPVHAAATGLVIFAGPDDAAIFSPWRAYYGNLIVIEHGNDLFTLYAHLSNVDVENGEEVTVGDKIGEVGRSGVAIGAHLHFEVRRGDVEDYFSVVNPELWLAPRQSSGVISLAIMGANSIFQRAEFTIQQYSSSNDLAGAYYLDTYHPSLAMASENAAIGELPAGRYRITLISNGHLLERWVDVESGKLTQVLIVVE